MTFKIALRYLFSKKKTQAIHVLSAISMTGIAGGAMALIVILSIFNGFENLVISLYNSFQPAIKIEATKGKYFHLTPQLTAQIQQTDGLLATSYSMEENAYFKYGEKAAIGVLKGVDEQFTRTSNIDSFIVDGTYQLSQDNEDFAVLGSGIQSALNTVLDQPFQQLAVYLPKKGTATAITPADAFQTGYLYPMGIFSIQQEFDEKYVLAPLSFVQYAAGVDSLTATSIELSIDPAKEKIILQTLSEKLGKDYRIRNRLQQNEALYRVMKIERFAVITILSFIIAIISFNILGSLMMLIIEKEKDMAILTALGMAQKKIKQIFLQLALLQAALAAAIGLGVGLLLCYLQKTYGWIKLGGGTFVVDAYPVDVRFSDILLVLCIILLICFVAALYPATKASKRNNIKLNS